MAKNAVKRVIKEGERIDPETLDRMKDCVDRWENKRKSSGLDKMTQKQRIANIEICLADHSTELKDDNKNIIRIYLLFVLQAIFNLGILLTITALK